MASNASRRLAQRIWSIANDLRGNMDSSKFKDYILGVIFYRYLSAHTENYMDDVLRNDGVTYREALSPDADPNLAEETKRWALEELGYLITPDKLFDSLVDRIKCGEFTIEDFEQAVNDLVGSTVGQESETAFANLFDAMNLKDSDLGKEVSDRTDLIKKVILKIHDTPFAATSEAGDVLGTAYMHLIGLFQSNAGKKGGEFFTPTSVSTLLAQLTTIGLSEARNVSDGCAGSGSLLLEVARHLPEEKVSHYYAQEKNGATFNLLRMNLIMHGIDYKRFTVFRDDTLKSDNFTENGKPILFDVQVENPPYSARNTASDESYLEDPRYSAAGVLAPESKADLAFVESVVYHMADDGRAAILLPHGVLFRGAAELDIRKYLIDAVNVVDAVIGLPANMFHGTSIPVCALLLKKNRNGNSENILFIDASRNFAKEGKSNVLRASDVKHIVDCVRDRSDIDGFSRKATLDEIRSNEYNLNIPRYVDSSGINEKWDVYSLIAGGLPFSEVDALQPYFDAFDGLKNALLARGDHAYSLIADPKDAVWHNDAIRDYVSSFESKVEDLRLSAEDLLIQNMHSINRDTEKKLVEKLFAAITDMPFVDRYDAYQHLSDSWQEVFSDAKLINGQGVGVIREYEPNMVLKKKAKSKELVEEQEGYRGKVLPFELVQEVYLAEDLADLKLLETAAKNAQAIVDGLVESLTDEDKTFEFNGSGIWDEGKDKLDTKGLNVIVRDIKRTYNDIDAFEEDSTERKAISLHKARDVASKAKSKHKKAKNAIDPKTMEVMDGLSDEESIGLLRRKWIDPYIENVALLARASIDNLVRKIETMQKKYEVACRDEEAEIAFLESGLADMLDKLRGDKTDEAGCSMWAEFLRGE